MRRRPDPDPDRPDPDFRAVVRRGTVRLVEWFPYLADGGPLGNLLRLRARAGVAVADLTVLRDDEGLADELVVTFHAGDTPAARVTLLGWAAAIGYRRAWLPGEVVDLEPCGGGPARTRCEACRMEWVDDAPGFWLAARHSGRFPTQCPLCGHDLPQWGHWPATTWPRGVDAPSRRGHLSDSPRVGGPRS